jgi:RNA polymerase sigma-70 factor (ECF subfamily)
VQNEDAFSEINVDYVDAFIDLVSDIDFENVPYNDLEKAIVSDELRYLIDQLSPDTLEAFKLYYYDDLQANEVADILNLPINTLKTRLFRGRQKLRSLIKEDMLVSTL